MHPHRPCFFLSIRDSIHWELFTGNYSLGTIRLLCAHREVPAQKGLQKAALAAVVRSHDVTAEHAALGLLLLQVDALVPRHCSHNHHTALSRQLYWKGFHPLRTFRDIMCTHKKQAVYSPVMASAWDSFSLMME